MDAGTATPPRLAQLGVFVFFAFAYLLGGSRAGPWSDGKLIHQVAESIVASGRIDIETDWYKGRDGRAYGVHPILPSLVHVPGAWLHLRVLERSPDPATHGPSRAITSHLGPAGLGGLVCLLFFRLAFALGLGAGVASLGTLALGFATIVSVYARYPYSEIAQTAAFTGFFGAVWRTAERPSRWGGLAAGLWAGALINTKLVFVLAFPGAIAFVAWRLRDRRAWRAVGLATLGLLPGVALAAWYNWARWGHPLETGYHFGPERYGEALWVGLSGLLLSPSKSLFLYSPPLLLALVAWWAGPRARRLWIALLLSAGPLVLSYAKLSFWSGDLAWGPRYLVFLTPLLVLLACTWLDARARGPNWRRAALTFGACVGVGLAVQLLANALYWDNSWRFTFGTRARWLGNPNRAGAPFVDRGGSCDPCFEDLAPTLYLPPWNPLAVNAWLLASLVEGRDAQRAEQRAPWRRYTSLPMDIREPYARVAIDWWFLDLRERWPRQGWTLLALFGLSTALGAWAWRRGASPAPEDQA